jgi:hypothetical protein
VVVLLLVLGVVGAVVVALMMSFIQAYPQVGFVLLVAVGIVALLAFLSAVYFLANRVHEYSHRIVRRRLILKAELDQREREHVVAERVWNAECEHMVIEQRKLDLEEQKIRLQAYQAQVVTVRHDHALVVRDYNGLGTRLAYEPVRGVGLVNEPQSHGLLSPPRCQISALSLLQDGQLDAGDLVLGFDEGGNLVRRTWRQLLSILILGLMGGGKTNTAIWIVFQLLLKGYRVALIDRHAKSDESTHARLKDFVTAYGTPVGDSVQAAVRVVKYVRGVLEDRRDRGTPVEYKLLFVVDEFAAIMRALRDSTSEWQPVATVLAGLIEDLNYEGRKYGVHVMCIGQAANASRSGGTEIRDLFHTRIIHGMRARQAQMLGLADEKQAIQRLETGQVYVDVEGRDSPFFMVVPEITEGFKQAVLGRLFPCRVDRELAENGGFSHVSSGVPARETWGFAQVAEIPKKLASRTTEDLSGKLPERVERVLGLRKTGMGKKAIILEVWQVRPGGSDRYKQAELEYTQIVENLTALGYLQA